MRGDLQRTDGHARAKGCLGKREPSSFASAGPVAGWPAGPRWLPATAGRRPWLASGLMRAALHRSHRSRFRVTSGARERSGRTAPLADRDHQGRSGRGPVPAVAQPVRWRAAHPARRPRPARLRCAAAHARKVGSSAAAACIGVLVTVLGRRHQRLPAQIGAHAEGGRHACARIAACVIVLRLPLSCSPGGRFARLAVGPVPPLHQALRSAAAGFQCRLSMDSMHDRTWTRGGSRAMLSGQCRATGMRGRAG
jgi:hypothetical protein